MSNLTVSFTESDLLASAQLSADWYKLLIKDITSKPGKSDPSATTFTVVCEVAEGPSRGVPITTYISTNRAGAVAEFVKALAGSAVVGKEYDLADAIGKHILGWAQWTEDGAFKSNKVDAWKKA